MSAREYTEWVLFDSLEPLPDPWLQTGILAAVLHNGLFPGSRKTPADFIPRTAPRGPQSADEGLARMKMIAAAMAATMGADTPERKPESCP